MKFYNFLSYIIFILEKFEKKNFFGYASYMEYIK